MQTLVLNVGYMPVERVPWQKAIVWVLERIAEVVEEYPDRYIRTTSWSVKMPSVVRLVKPIQRKRAVKFSRYNVYARDGGRCQYCGSKVPREEMQYEHVVPRSQGGKTCWENIVVACMPCNQRKAGRTPEQAGMRLRLSPVRPKKLPEIRRPIAWTDGMPNAWRSWLRSEVYWNVELESDGNS